MAIIKCGEDYINTELMVNYAKRSMADRDCNRPFWQCTTLSGTAVTVFEFGDLERWLEREAEKSNAAR